jgi:hypothetical protein
MGLIELILVLAVIGFVLWAIVTFIPMPPPFKQAIIAIVAIIVVLWVARLLLGSGPDIRIGR